MKIKLVKVGSPTVEVKKGFSWTTLIFGFMPDMLRGRYASAFKMMVLLFVADIFGKLNPVTDGDYVIAYLAAFILTGIYIWYAFKRNAFMLAWYKENGYIQTLNEVTK